LPLLLDVYEDPDTTAEEKQYLLDSLREHNKSLMEMLDKLLFWGQSLVKGIRMQAQVLSVNEIVQQNIELKKLTLQEKLITITDKVPQNLKVNADITHFDFIVRNLISNAIKYTFSGGAITISADADKVPGYVVMAVTDTGTGIAADLLAKVFAPEQSIPGTADEKGTGIGLMLCKEFAYLNGGDIWAESEVGKGATFYFKVKKA
jgi:signal transduction histidine kinase